MFVLKQLRRKKKINQTDLANAIGVSLRTIQLYEKRNANIPIKNLMKIADYFGTTIAELYSHEVNEEESGYGLTSENYNKGVQIKSINAKKKLVTVPLLTVENYELYCTEFKRINFLNELPLISFLIENFETANYIAFEIAGNSMDNGTIDSIPDKSVVLCKELMLENDTIKEKIENSNVMLLYKDNVLCKQISAYDKAAKRIRCHSLSPSPEYADFFAPLSEVKQLFKVLKKQTN